LANGVSGGIEYRWASQPLSERIRLVDVE
jgi:hypothetical protein